MDVAGDQFAFLFHRGTGQHFLQPVKLRRRTPPYLVHPRKGGNLRRGRRQVGLDLIAVGCQLPGPLVDAHRLRGFRGHGQQVLSELGDFLVQFGQSAMELPTGINT
ncbi:MAG: hypothetical protein AAFY88_06825 [Acidobacteriota bacterium]